MNDEDNSEEILVDSLIKSFERISVQEPEVKVEHGIIEIKVDGTTLVSYRTDDWIQDPELVIQIAEDINCLYKEGSEAIKKRVDKRIHYFGEPVGVRITIDGKRLSVYKSTNNKK